MNGNRGRIRTIAVTLALILSAVMLGGVSEAAVGDTLATVTIPDAAGCSNADSTTFGDVLTVVPGGKLGFPATPTLLVTNCRQAVGDGSVSRLFFLDPSTNPATVKGTVDTGGFGAWEALTFRSDTADLLGCQLTDGPPDLYVIHFSPYDTVAAPGTASLLTTAPGNATCDGIAWDSKDKSIYQTSTNFDESSGSFSVLKYSASNSSTFTAIPIATMLP